MNSGSSHDAFRRFAPATGALATLLCLAIACSAAGQQGQGGAFTSDPFATSPQTGPVGARLATYSAPKPIEGSRLVAKVGSQVVLDSELAWLANQRLAEFAGQIPPHMVDEVRQQAMQAQLAGLINVKLVLDHLTSKVPPEAITSVQEQLSEPFEEDVVPSLIEQYEVKNRAELAEKLHEQGTSLDLMRQSFLEQRMYQMWLQEQSGKPTPITRDELYQHYTDRISEYEYPAQVKWQELMVRFDRFGGDKQAAWAALAQLGNQVKQFEARREGISFEQAAKQGSHGFTASEGGMHDWTEQGSLVAEQVDRALFSLPVGAMSRIIPGPDELYIVRVLERKPAGRTAFEDAQAEIREELTRERRNEKRKQFLQRLRDEVRIWTAYTGETTATRYAQSLQSRATATR